jgi:hypothetical protein
VSISWLVSVIPLNRFLKTKNPKTEVKGLLRVPSGLTFVGLFVNSKVFAFRIKLSNDFFIHDVKQQSGTRRLSTYLTIEIVGIYIPFRLGYITCSMLLL